MAVEYSGDGLDRAPHPCPDRSHHLEALYRISTALSSASTLEHGLNAALDGVLAAFGCPVGVIRLLEPATGQLTLVARAGVHPELREDLERPVYAGDGPGGLSVQQRSLVFIPDLSASPYGESVWARHGMRSFISAPLFSQGMLLGCLNMASPEVRGLTEADREFLAILINQIGMSVAVAELYGAAQRKIEYLSALHECSRDVGPAPTIEHVEKIATERAAQLLRLDRCAIIYWDQEADELLGGAGCGFSLPELKQVRAPLSELPAAANVLREGQVWLAEDAAAEGLLPPEAAAALEVQSAIATPLVAHDRTLGFLLGDRNNGVLGLSADEIDLAMIFANQASVWLAGARLLVDEQAARRAAEASEAKFRELLEVAPDAILLVGEDGRIRLANREAERMFGYGSSELQGVTIEALIPERFRHEHIEHRARYYRESRTRPMGIGLDLFALRRDGGEFPVEISLSPSRTDGSLEVIAIIRDISDRQAAEAERQQLLERERRKSEQLKLAVREAHHRIKNNLQAISDLLYLELSSYDDPHVADVLRESVERIQSIALVHDLLSQDEDVQTVDTRAMAERLVPMVLQSGGRRNAPVTLDLHVPAIQLSSKRATSLALILNELVSNAVKHAYQARAGRLSVRLEQANEGLQLTVQDDGPGLPPDFDFRANANVGLQVVRTLAERDLGGKFSLSTGPGLAATVWFPW